jgi:hypothetical protein
MHDSVVRAIANTSFIEFIAENAASLSQDCASGWAHEIILRSMRFIIEYSARENLSLCFGNISGDILVGCEAYPEVDVYDFIVNNTNQVQGRCEEDHLESIVRGDREKWGLSGATKVIEFVTKYEFAGKAESGICAVAEAVVEQIGDWEDRQKEAICGLARKVNCSAFEGLDLNALCLPADETRM